MTLQKHAMIWPMTHCWNLFKDFKPEVILSDDVIDCRMKMYKAFKKSIDEAKPIMYVELGEEK